MIVQCPSCSTGFRLGAAPVAGTALRCSRCLAAFPCPRHRRTYVLGPARAAAPAPLLAPYPVSSLLEPMEGPIPAPEAVPAAAAIAPAPVEGTAELPASPQAPRRRAASREAELSVALRTPSLLPPGLAAAGAAAAWLAAPGMPEAWAASLPFPVERWMLSAGGAAAGLVLSGVWLAWRAARR